MSNHIYLKNQSSPSSDLDTFTPSLPQISPAVVQNIYIPSLALEPLEDLTSTHDVAVQKRKHRHSPTGPIHKSQYKINFICSCLAQCKIYTRKDLIERLDELTEKICAHPNIFKPDQSTQEHVDLFKSAVQSYSHTNALNLSIRKEDTPCLKKLLTRALSYPCCASVSSDDLSRVTQGYDELAKAFMQARTTSQAITETIEFQNFITCPHIILGIGDTGTTLWMEKYKAYHRKTHEQLSQGYLPEVLMLGDMFGSWKHDYTLAQPHNILERGSAEHNPSDFISQNYYKTNPYANARHVYQANITNLAKTNAPLFMGTKVVAIEKRNNHVGTWKNSTCEYRLIVLTPVGKKEIYTRKINICTGLGPAKNALEDKIHSSSNFQELCLFDPLKQFTPIVDGNQFILTDSEEQTRESRTIVVYGGGGTAAACYRKGFFGNDIKTEHREFNAQNKQNSVLWISARGFDMAGKGKLVTTALKAAGDHNELFVMELQEILYNSGTGKLHLTFRPPSQADDAAQPTVPLTIECDQLVYSIGQEDMDLKALCREFDHELYLAVDEAEMPLGIETKDHAIHFFGAAAMAIRQKEYASATWKWLHRENIGPDVGPGSMPPSRAQIRQYASKMGITTKSINVNSDDHRLIKQFLQNLGIPPHTISLFVHDILQARKHSTSGFTNKILRDLVDSYQIHDKVRIVGHGHLAQLPSNSPIGSRP
ncbi:MAG: hypothetical protein KGZ39_08615 [Simkania sp.]|nr:hypothetical protein [Simkania sp.]